MSNIPSHIHPYLCWATHIGHTCKALMLAMILSLLSLGHALASKEQYTKDRPLIILCDCENSPYEFSNFFGVPAGFYIDVLNAILDEHDIPHKFVVKEWPTAVNLFENRQGDIILDPIAYFSDKDSAHYVSSSILSYTKLKIASLKQTPNIVSSSQLRQAKGIVFKANDPLANRLLQFFGKDINYEFHSPRDAMAGIDEGQYSYFIWDEESLNRLAIRLRMDQTIKISPLTLLTCETHIVGYDNDIISLIDDNLARMELSGDLKEIHDHWFHPERLAYNSSPISIYIVIASSLFILIILAFIHLAHEHVNQTKQKNVEFGEMMHQVIKMGKYNVLKYDVRNDLVVNSQGYLLPQNGLTKQQFIDRVHPDTRESAKKKIAQLLSGEMQEIKANTLWNRGTEEEPDWIFMHGHAVSETDRKSKVRYIIANVKDLTKDMEEEHKKEELINKFIQMYDSLLVPMSFYDKNGHLIDLNKEMKKLCGFDTNSGAEEFYYNTCIFDLDIFTNDYDFMSGEVFNVCQHMSYSDHNVDKYIEYKIQPVLSKEGEIVYYTFTARDITEERQMYLSLKEHNTQLQEANKRINYFEQQLQYLLKNSNMYVFRTDNVTQQIQFSYSLTKTEYSLSYKEYVNLMYENDRKAALELINDPERLHKPFNVVHHFKTTPINNEPSWYIISAMPLHNSKGEFIGHFGVVRDITELLDTQEQLRIERERADFSGRQKSAFLANMTHEIRTPLNAIVGFSDLMQLIDDPNDRNEFIRIILNNCDMLLRLIDDILAASDIRQTQLSIETKDVDFAVVFNDICQTLAQRVQEPGVEFVKENPYEHFHTHIDKGRIQQVCTNFVTNAVKYTHQGHIKLGYRYENNGLYIYCEDTGTGIPKDKQEAVFERFVKLNDVVQGTGLGLNICKMIAEQCNGKIGVNSEGIGHGSTFWIWIPCEQKTV